MPSHTNTRRSVVTKLLFGNMPARVVYGIETLLSRILKYVNSIHFDFMVSEMPVVRGKSSDRTES